MRRPSCDVGRLHVIARSGERSRYALPTPVVKLVAPGPRVAMQRPGKLVMRPMTSAANAAEPSCAVRTYGRPPTRIASSRGRTLPLGIPKPWLTPAARSVSTMSRALSMAGTLSVLVEHALDLAHVVGPREGQHGEHARLLWIEIVGDHKALLAQHGAGQHAPAAGPARDDDQETAAPRLLQRLALGRRRHAGGERRRDDGPRAHRNEGADGRAVGAGVRRRDIDAREIGAAAHVELRRRRVAPRRPAVDRDATVRIGVAEHANVGAPEGLQ